MLYQRINNYLEANGINKSALARGCDVTVSSMSQYLTGRVRIPADVYLRICMFLKVSADIFRDDQPAD